MLSPLALGCYNVVQIMVLSTLQCGADYGFIHIRGAVYRCFFHLGSCHSSFLGFVPFYTQFQMKLATILILVCISFIALAMLIGIFISLGCGYNLLAFVFIGLFLALLLLPLVEVQLDIRSFLARLIYAFHI